MTLALGSLILLGLVGLGNPLNDASYIASGKLDRDKEGKLVILAGRLEVELPFRDPATDLSIPYFAAYRKTDIFSHIVDTDFNYTWYALYWDPLKEDKGVNLDELSSSILIAPIKMGDYSIDPRIFKEIEFTENWNEIRDEDLGDYKLYIHKSRNDGRTYLSESEYIPDEAAEYKGNEWYDDEDKRRYSYEVYKSKEPLDFTIVGVQKGEWLMLDDDLDATYIKKGIESKEDFIKDNGNRDKGMGLGFTAIGASLLAIAGYCIIKRNKEE